MGDRQDTQSRTPLLAFSTWVCPVQHTACYAPLLGNLAANHASMLLPLPYGGARESILSTIAHPGSIIASFGRNGQNSASYPPATHISQHAPGSQARLGGSVSVHGEQRWSSAPRRSHTISRQRQGLLPAPFSFRETQPVRCFTRCFQPGQVGSGHCGAGLFSLMSSPSFHGSSILPPGRRTASVVTKLSREASAAAAFNGLGADSKHPSSPPKSSVAMPLSPDAWDGPV